MNEKAVILLSGGLDSATTLYLAIAKGFDAYCISFSYGQRHKIELESAKKIARAAGAKDHVFINTDLGAIGGSALTDKIDVPKNSLDSSGLIPVTYVPARNLVFLSLALAYAERIGAYTIVIGANAIDYSGYPDCRPEFLNGFEKLAALATVKGAEGGETFKIWAPLIKMSKAEIIIKGVELGLNVGATHSCYDPMANGKPCGCCDSCLLRKKGFYEAGLSDSAML